MSAWIHSGNSSLDPGKKGDLSLNRNPLLAAEKWFKKSLDFILTFQTPLPLLKWSGWGGGRWLPRATTQRCTQYVGSGWGSFVLWVRKNKTPLAAEELRLDSLMNNLAGHKVGSKWTGFTEVRLLAPDSSCCQLMLPGPRQGANS